MPESLKTYKERCKDRAQELGHDLALGNRCRNCGHILYYGTMGSLLLTEDVWIMDRSEWIGPNIKCLELVVRGIIE